MATLLLWKIPNNGNPFASAAPQPNPSALPRDVVAAREKALAIPYNDRAIKARSGVTRPAERQEINKIAKDYIGDNWNKIKKILYYQPHTAMGSGSLGYISDDISRDELQDIGFVVKVAARVTVPESIKRIKDQLLESLMPSFDLYDTDVKGLLQKDINSLNF